MARKESLALVVMLVLLLPLVHGFVDGGSVVTSDSTLVNCSVSDEIFVYTSTINKSSIECGNVTNVIMYDSAIKDASRNITDANLTFASILDNVLAAGKMEYGGWTYYGPFDIDDIYAGVPPSETGVVGFSANAIGSGATFFITYSVGSIGYTVTADATSVGGGAALILLDNGAGNDDVANDGVYTSANVTASGGSGSENIVVDINDNLGNQWQLTRPIYVDNNPPTGSIYISDADENEDSVSTDSRVVGLRMTASDDIEVDACRVANNGTDISSISFDNCQSSLPWVLEPLNGEKMVIYQVRDTSGNIKQYNDTIDLNMPTLPGPEVDDYVSYWGYTDRIHFRLYYDSAVSTEGVTYDYRIYNESKCAGPADYNEGSSACNITGWRYTESTNIWDYDVTLGENTNYTIGARSYSGGISTQSFSDGFVLDLTGPTIDSVQASVANTTWTSDAIIRFNISASDAQSGVSGYSYRISTSNLQPDDAIDVSGENATIYFTGLGEGTYYLNIRAKSGSTIMSSSYHYVLYVDTTMPPIPLATTPVAAGIGTLRFNWTSVNDTSGIQSYEVVIATDPYFENIEITANTTNTYYDFTSTKGANYYFKVRALNNAGLYSMFSTEYDAELDTVAPRFLLAKPSGTVIKEKPRLYLETNEKAECYYRESSEVEMTQFGFTGNQFHEEILSLDDTQSYTYLFTCYDSVGNYNSSSVSFTIDTAKTPTSISYPSSTLTAFTGSLQDFDITMKSSSLNVGELDLSKFDFLLNEKSIEFSVNDRGDGVYRISFEVPQEKGPYTIEVCYENLCTGSISMTVQELVLEVSMQLEGGSTINQLTKISYADQSGNYSMGIASDARIMSFNHSAATNLMRVKSIVGSGNTYLFFVDKTTDIAKKNKKIERGTFFIDNNPSFSRAVSDTMDLSIGFDYGNLVFTGRDVSSRGDHSMLIVNKGLTSDKKVNISIEVT
jgi:hypothetical protein